MKKNLLLAGLLLAFSLGAVAQNNATTQNTTTTQNNVKAKRYKSYAFGFKLGPNFNWIGSTTGEAQNERLKTDFNLGFDAEFYFTDNYAIVTGLNVNFINGRYTYEDMRDPYATESFKMGTVDRTFKTTAFEIPLMVKMMTEQFGLFKYFAELGVGFGLSPRVNVKDTFQFDQETNPIPLDNDIYRRASEEYTSLRFDVRGAFGLQYTIQGTTRVFADVYYAHNFLNSIQWIGKNYRKYYNGNKDLGERPNNLNVVQNQFGIEVGILF